MSLMFEDIPVCLSGAFLGDIILSSSFYRSRSQWTMACIDRTSDLQNTKDESLNVELSQMCK